MPGLGSDLVVLLSRRGGGRTGNGRAEELVAWANRAIEAGLDDEVICILAGESGPLYSSEVDELVRRVLDQLNLPEPSTRDELLDAEMHIICGDVESGAIEPEVGLASVSQIVIWNRPLRFGDWLGLCEDVAIMEYGDHPVIIPGLNRENIGLHVRRIAQATLHALPRPDWLDSYVVLDQQG